MLNRLAAALLASLLVASANADTPRRNLLHSAPLATMPLSASDDIEVVQGGYSTRIPATTAVPVFNVLSYGAVCDGVTNDSVAIQAAINAAASAGGGVVTIPSRTCSIGATTISIGNGSSSAYSTKSGVTISGASSANSLFGVIGNTDVPRWRIKYSGSNEAIKIAGPLSGWGIQGIQIECTNVVGSKGLAVISAQYGDSRNFSIKNCNYGVYSDTVSAKPAGISNVDSLHNTYENYQIIINATSAVTYYGTVETGNSIANSDFGNFRNGSIIAMTAVSGSTVYDTYLGATDSSLYTNIHSFGSVVNGGGGVTRHITVFDYTNPGNPAWPAGTTLTAIEGYVKGAPINIGTPPVNPVPNYWYATKYNNGGQAVILDNLISDSLKGSWIPDLVGTTTTGSVTYDNNTGTYEASGYDVFVRFTVDTSAFSGFAGAIAIPIPIPVFDGASSSARGACTMGAVGGITNTAGYTNVSAWVDPTAQAIQFLQNGSGSPIGFLSAASLSNDTVLSGSCVYRRK